jgi:hypothetical protein
MPTRRRDGWWSVRCTIVAVRSRRCRSSSGPGPPHDPVAPLRGQGWGRVKSVSFRRKWPRGWTRIGASPRSSGVATLPHPTPHTAWRPTTHRQFPLCTGRTETGCAPHSSYRRGGARAAAGACFREKVETAFVSQACCRAAYVAYIRPWHHRGEIRQTSRRHWRPAPCHG